MTHKKASKGLQNRTFKRYRKPLISSVFFRPSLAHIENRRKLCGNNSMFKYNKWKVTIARSCIGYLHVMNYLKKVEKYWMNFGSRVGLVVRALAFHHCARVPDSIPRPDLDWLCLVSTLFREVFSRVLRFSPLTKRQHLNLSQCSTAVI